MESWNRMLFDVIDRSITQLTCNAMQNKIENRCPQVSRKSSFMGNVYELVFCSVRMSSNTQFV